MLPGNGRILPLVSNFLPGIWRLQIGALWRLAAVEAIAAGHLEDLRILASRCVGLPDMP